MRVVHADASGITEALRVLRDGGTVAHATETCYGFACDMTNVAAVEKLFTIKYRPHSQPVSALFASVNDAKRYVVWNEEVETLAKKYLPGPLTLILPMRADVPEKISPLSDSLCPIPSLGIRISSHPIAHALAAAYENPISTTSANIHGEPNPYSVEDIQFQFAGQFQQPDLILDSGQLPEVPPSTVIDLMNGKGAKTLRKGIV